MLVAALWNPLWSSPAPQRTRPGYKWGRRAAICQCMSNFWLAVKSIQKKSVCRIFCHMEELWFGLVPSCISLSKKERKKGEHSFLLCESHPRVHLPLGGSSLLVPGKPHQSRRRLWESRCLRTGLCPIQKFFSKSFTLWTWFLSRKRQKCYRETGLRKIRVKKESHFPWNVPLTLQ